MLFPYFNYWSVSIMEARNFITAREMFLDDNWLLTTMNGAPRYEKPPFPTWMSAVFGSIFGINSTFAMRIPTAIMLFLVGVFTHNFTLRFINKEHALINALIAITSFYVIGITVEAPWDIYTHGFMLGSIYFLYSAFNQFKTSYIIYAILFWALSVLSKGPVGLFALFLPFILAYFFTYRFSKKKLVQALLVLVAGSALGAIWFIYVRMADPDTFHEITSRETQNWSSYNVKPFYYYWSFFIQSGMWTIPAFVGLLYPYLKSRVENLKAYKLTLLWTIFSVVLLSCIPEKKSRYLMPVLIPLALNTGFYIQYLIKNFKTKSTLFDKIIVNLHFGIFCLAAFSSIVGGIILYRKQPDLSLTLIIVGVMVFTTIGVALLDSIRKRNVKSMFVGSILFYVSVMCFLPTVLAGSSKQKDFIQHVNATKAIKDKPEKHVFFLDYISPELMWYCERIVPQVENKKNGQKIEYTLPDLEQFGLLVDLEENMNMKEWSKKYHIEKQETYDINIPSSHRSKHRYLTHYYLFTKK
jgi:4-amino-4-deoxy-L-arabinose transferase-like glycosyltransferase